jgi:hypothetical protein
MSEDLRKKLMIPEDRLASINSLFAAPDMRVIDDFLGVVQRYGTPEQINAKAAAARQLPTLFQRVQETNPAHISDLEWLREQRDAGAFIGIEEYRRKIFAGREMPRSFHEDFAVTLEISACQYFPWIREISERAIENDMLMPGRFIRVRKMKEQEADGDLPAFAAAMEIIGSSYVETLDTRGTDGSNIHLGGPETITGYFGGVGQPNQHALEWLDEFLYYFTEYGVRQVLNVNPGTVLLGYMLHRLGVDIEFKISVFMGNDNAYAALWTLIGAKLFAREDGSTPLIGFNWSNSVDNESMEITAQFREDLGFEDVVRFEHHITETFKSIVVQPYNRRPELLEIADHIKNISAKHEGGDVEIERQRQHPSDILDYFRDKREVISSGEWDALRVNFIDKFDSLNRTARALTERGLSVVAAAALHH